MPQSLSKKATSPTSTAEIEDNQLASQLRESLFLYLEPLLFLLDSLIDVRLVRTLHQAIETILVLKDRHAGLLLSELGGYLLSPDKAPAGTKRLSNLLRSSKWSAKILQDFLWKKARERAQQLIDQNKTILLAWDESVIEKTESRKIEGLCPVRSSKAKRLEKSRKTIPGKPILVNGMHWFNILIMGLSGPVQIACMHWFTTRGKGATDARAVQAKAMLQCHRLFGRHALHIFDRGYAGKLWLEACLTLDVRLLVRWPKRYQLLDDDDLPKAAWRYFQGQRAREERIAWDAVNKRPRRISLLWEIVHHESWSGPLYLLCARPGDGKEPWYLLTNEIIRNGEDAWRLVLAYARRWQVEMSFRFAKSEMGMESPRLWTWERREKLLLLVTLAYSFLLSFLSEGYRGMVLYLLRRFCHRTGKANRERAAPLYRIRSALSRLWKEHPESRAYLQALNSG
jgi:hypothetical protein